MNYQTRTILRHGLPVVFWLLAIGVGIAIPYIFDFSNPNYWWGYAVTALVLFCLVVLKRIDRHKSSAEECFQCAVLLGIASYWLPTVVFLNIPFWGFVIYRTAFSRRAFWATIMGYVLVAVHAAILVWFGWIDNVWAEFFAPERLWSWIPLGAILLAWLGSTIVQQTLRER